MPYTIYKLRIFKGNGYALGYCQKERVCTVTYEKKAKRIYEELKKERTPNVYYELKHEQNKS